MRYFMVLDDDLKMVSGGYNPDEGSPDRKDLEEMLKHFRW